jgi:hypothetical protein
MRNKYATLIVIAIGSSIVPFTFMSAKGKETAVQGMDQKAADEVPAQIETKAIDIRKRLHLPAMLEDHGNEGEEMEIAELYHSGWIIKASIKEVEAALQAAAATPNLDDDIEARILAHRASCRYFLSE